jgi:hypothetical protein
VIAMGVDTSFSENTFRYPIVEFEDRSGNRITFEASIREEPPAHRMGQIVPVYYNPSEPKQADIVGSEVRSAVLLLALGLPFLAAGIGMFVHCVVLRGCGEAH